MKKTVSLLLSAALIASLAACGGGEEEKPQAETLTGSAEGFSSTVTVTLTREDGKITACAVDASGETESIGAAAAEELGNQVVAAGGYDIDGVSGATVTTEAVKTAVAQALGEEYSKPTPAPAPTPVPKEDVTIEGGLQLGLAYGAAHGTKCFSEAYAVVQGDTIVAAYIDEFQFMAAEGVPNSDADFAAGYADPATPLVSKRVNNETYSALMTDHAGSTVSIADNYDAIQDFVVGKTIAEVKEAAGQENAVDAVSGATLADTAGYLGLIAQAAENAQGETAVEFTGDASQLKLNVAYGAAHGTKCFTAAAALTQGDTILLSYIDEFQFVASDAGLECVPNSDADFAAGYAEGKALASKRAVADYYSKNMAEKGGATVRIDDNFDAIQNHVNGMTIADAEALAADKETAVDAVSGATLADTAGYVGVIVAAAKG